MHAHNGVRTLLVWHKQLLYAFNISVLVLHLGMSLMQVASVRRLHCMATWEPPHVILRAVCR